MTEEKQITKDHRDDVAWKKMEEAINLGIDTLKNDLGLLYIRDEKDRKFESPEEVISYMYGVKGSSRTMHAANDAPQSTGSYRSIRDICMVVLYYLPDTSIESIIKAIYNGTIVLGSGNTSRLLEGYCSTVGHIVHHLSAYPSNGRNMSNRSRNSTIPGILWNDLMNHYNVFPSKIQ